MKNICMTTITYFNRSLWFASFVKLTMCAVRIFLLLIMKSRCRMRFFFLRIVAGLSIDFVRLQYDSIR